MKFNPGLIRLVICVTFLLMMVNFVASRPHSRRPTTSTDNVTQKMVERIGGRNLRHRLSGSDGSNTNLMSETLDRNAVLEITNMLFPKKHPRQPRVDPLDKCIHKHHRRHHVSKAYENCLLRALASRMKR